MRRTAAVVVATAVPSVILATLTSTSSNADPLPTFERLGTYSTGLGEESAEIAALDGDRMYVINSTDNSLDVVDVSDPADPRRQARVSLARFGAGPNSVAVRSGLVAVAVESEPATDPGHVVFLNPAGRVRGVVEVGSLPDMLTFTPDGRMLVVANEGEPSGYEAGDVDPEGSVSVISLRPRNVRDATVRTVTFDDLSAAQQDELRLNGPGATVAQDVEPEYVAVSDDSRTAWVTLQEANAFATVDLTSATVSEVHSFGWKDHSVNGYGLDASDKDGSIAIDTWPVRGLYMPDAVAHFTANGRQLIVTANEGDGREYDGLEDEIEVEDLTLSSTFGDADARSQLQQEENLGSLTVSATDGVDANGEHEALYSFGARSFSVWDAESGVQVHDSGDSFEQITALAVPAHFNASNTDNRFDSRSDNKGPEPEGVAVGVVGGRTYAFIGLERIGGLMVYDVTDPTSPVFVQWVNNRDYSDPEFGPDGGPEGVSFYDGTASPTGRPVVLVSHEITGTVSLYTPGG